MPKDHVGVLSGVTYRIPALADRRDVEVAFGEFADSIPAAPMPLKVEKLTANVTAAVDTLYTSDSATGYTVTLPAGSKVGDRVLVLQLGTGVINVNGIGAGVPVTAGANTAVTAVWDGTRWVGAPFSFSGTRPTESSGGVVTDLNGFRYHAFTTPGTYTFISHKALTVEGYIVGGGADGQPAAAADGAPGVGGAVVNATGVAIGDWTFTTVVVGGPGQKSSFGAQEALPATGQAAVPLTGDWATVIAETSLSGPGGLGPAAPSTFGIGGGGGIKLNAAIARPSHTESYQQGGGWVDQSYAARAETVQDGYDYVVGDPPVGNGSGWSCPGGWWVAGGCIGPTTPGYRPSGCNCVTQVPKYKTIYHCDSGGSLSGTTCVKGYQDPGQTVTTTVWDPCPGGYVVGGDTTTCVDARPAGAGKGGGGLVAIRYPRP